MDEDAQSAVFKRKGLVATANEGPDLNSSNFFLTLTGDHLETLDKKHTIFGKVVEGLEILDKINSAYCSADGEPMVPIRIRHSIVIDDPFDDPAGLVEPSRSPSPEKDDDIEGMIKQKQNMEEETEKVEAKAKAEVLTILGDLPEADIKPPENVLFVCKLNPVTQSHDLELIFSRFGKISSCDVIRDWKTGDSLQYAFIEFEDVDACIQAYHKMEGVQIDERRIHVDFSQSVAKEWIRYKRGNASEVLKSVA